VPVAVRRAQLNGVQSSIYADGIAAAVGRMSKLTMLSKAVELIGHVAVRDLTDDNDEPVEQKHH